MTVRVPFVLMLIVLVAAAALAAVSLNVLLLGRTSSENDPVGRLLPRAHLPAAPHWTIRPAHGRIEDGGLDD